MTAKFYTSDSPCRRCNGTERYKNTALRGQCTGCVRDDEGEKRARAYVLDSDAPLQPSQEADIEFPLIWDEDDL